MNKKMYIVTAVDYHNDDPTIFGKVINVSYTSLAAGNAVKAHFEICGENAIISEITLNKNVADSLFLAFRREASSE